MDLETQTDRRLRAAGIQYGDPGLAHIRRWNARAYAKAAAAAARGKVTGGAPARSRPRLTLVEE